MTENNEQIVLPFRYWVWGRVKASLPYLYKSFFSVLIFICICISHNFFPSITTKINKYPNIESLFLTFGSVLCAITALTISLAIIPIQRAIEIFSPTIRRNYLNDIVVHIILISLGIFIFISFSLAFLDFSNNWKVYFQFEIIAISLDLIRWHFRRISFLLEPSNAIKSLSNRICSLISKTQKIIAISSYKALKKTPRAEWSQELFKQIELYYYNYFEAKYVLNINFRIDELEDIALRAITRSERLTARYGINAIVEIAYKYLDSRKVNFKLHPAGLFSFGSDLDVIINPAYEKLLNICRLSIHNHDEQSGIQVVKGISSIAMKTMELKGFHKHTAPLASLPIGYLGMCAELSYKSDLNEISYNVVNELSSISMKAPDNLTIGDVHLQVLRKLSAIAKQEFILKNDHIGTRAVSNICRIACHLVEHNHYDFRSFLSLLLKELETLVHIMILKEKGMDMNAFPQYSWVNDFSLGHIVTIAASHIKIDEDRKWLNPYHDFCELNNEIYMHFRHIAENVLYDVQKSFLSWQIAETIKHVAKVYLHVLKKKLTDFSDHNKELIGQIGWYQSCLEFMFYNKKEIYPQKAEEASDAIATIGLIFLHDDYNEVGDTSICRICAIAKLYIEKTDRPDIYSIADMLICAWHLRCLAEHKCIDPLIQKADKKIKEVFDLALTKQVDIQEVFELRKEQLNRHLQSYEHLIVPTHSQDHLKLFILNSKKAKDTSEQGRSDEQQSQEGEQGDK